MKTEHTSEFALPRRVCWCSQICHLMPRSALHWGGPRNPRSRKSKNSKLLGIENWIHHWIHQVKASSDLQEFSENVKFWPLKIDLRNSDLVLLVLVLVFWFSGFLVPAETLNCNFPAIGSSKIFDEYTIGILERRRICQWRFHSKIPSIKKTLIFKPSGQLETLILISRSTVARNEILAAPVDSPHQGEFICPDKIPKFKIFLSIEKSWKMPKNGLKQAIDQIWCSMYNLKNIAMKKMLNFYQISSLTWHLLE